MGNSSAQEMSRGIIAHQRHKLVGLETTWVRIFFLVLTRCVMLDTNHISLFLTSDHTNVLFPSPATVKESLPQQGLDPKLLRETRFFSGLRRSPAPTGLCCETVQSPSLPAFSTGAYHQGIRVHPAGARQGSLGKTCFSLETVS